MLPSPGFEDQVRAAKMAQFYGLIPASARTNVALSVIVALALIGHAPPLGLLVWVGMCMAAITLRIKFYRDFVETDPEGHAASRWERRATLALGLSGAAWGLGLAVLFPQDAPLLQALVLIALCGVAAGVAFANTFHPPSLVAYIVPLLVPAIVRLAWQGSALHVTMATGMSVFLLFVLITGKHQARGTDLTIRQGFENERLAQALAQERDAADAARALAEEAGRSKSRFFAAANHDLRQPLHALSLSASALQVRPDAPAEAEVIDNLHASIAALETLFDSVLDVARLDAQRGPVALLPVALQPLLTRLVATYRPQARERNLDLRLRVPPKAAVLADALMLERIISNFLVNALRYTRDGAVLLAVQRRGKAWRIGVWDTGIGIAKEDQARVFDEFTRLESAHAEGERGVGLGLASARRMAALLGSAAEIRSVPEQGSVFWLTLSACELPTPQASASSTAAGAALPDSPLARRSVLLVEDNPLAAQSLAALLGNDAARVMMVYSLAQARTILAREKVDLVISDVDLGKGDSGLALNDIAEPLIFLTGSTDEATLAALAASGRPVLIKPVKPVRLKAAIAAALRAR